jgi:hypothetical protein
VDKCISYITDEQQCPSNRAARSGIPTVGLRVLRVLDLSSAAHADRRCGVILDTGVTDYGEPRVKQQPNSCSLHVDAHYNNLQAHLVYMRSIRSCLPAEFDAKRTDSYLMPGIVYLENLNVIRVLIQNLT